MNPTAYAGTAGLDIAFISLLMFIAFFGVLVFWLHGQSKLEGYPLEKDGNEARLRSPIIGFPAPPAPKTFRTTQGDVTVAAGRPDTRSLALKPFDVAPGMPFDPTGDPLVDGVGPASYAERADRPDVMSDNTPRLMPLRVAKDFHVEGRDPNPIGMSVVAGNGESVGKVTEIWIDRAEYVARYFEAEVQLSGGATRTVLIPINFTRIDSNAGKVVVKALYGKHFANIPTTRNADVVTLLEEDKIMGYFGGGTLYAGKRMEPFL